MTRRARALLAISTAILVSSVGTPAAFAAGNLSGEGESWPFPGIQSLLINGTRSMVPLLPVYTDVGEATAKTDAAAGTTDYAVCSSPMSSADTAAATKGHRVLKYVPYMAGAVAVVVALDIDQDHGGGRITHVTLTVPTIAKLFTHGLALWSDPEILAENPGIDNLQHLSQPQVIAITRRDSSSSTAALISLFLSDPAARKIWNDYATGLGEKADTPLDQWPNDPGTQTRPIITGSKGVIDTILGLDPITGQRYRSATSHHISYLAPSWALQYDAPMATLASNDLATKVDPTAAAITKSLTKATLDPRTNLVHLQYGITPDGAYPATLVSYLLVPTKGLDASKAKSLSGLVRFAFSSAGQKVISAKSYVPVTPVMKTAGLAVATALAAQGSSPATTHHSSGGGSSGGGGGSGGSGTHVQGETLGGLPRTGGMPAIPFAGAGAALFMIGEIARRRLSRSSN